MEKEFKFPENTRTSPQKEPENMGNKTNEQPLSPKLQKFFELMKKVWDLTREIPEARRKMLFQENLKIVKGYKGKRIKSCLANPTDEDLKREPTYYAALIYEARQRGIYEE